MTARAALDPITPEESEKMRERREHLTKMAQRRVYIAPRSQLRGDFNQIGKAPERCREKK